MSTHDEHAEFASWWRPLTRREFGESTVALAALAALAGVETGCRGCLGSGPPDQEQVEDSLKLQREHGWAIGQEQRPLALPGSTANDSQGGLDWKRYATAGALTAALTPAAEAWKPFFVPTLIQSLGQATLQQKMTPVYGPDMHEAHARGEAVARDLLPATESPKETAVIVDLPGRQAVAFAAGMADAATIVVTFDNWPHPLGVVKSEEPLGALLYYAAEIDAKKAQLKPDAPTVFVLDSNRLAPFSNADTQFDNRYIAELPKADALASRGVKNLLYIVPDRSVQHELDDLNDTFVAYKQAGLNVAVFPAADLQRAAEPEKQTVQTEAGPRETVVYRYYYGGYPHTHFYFFTYYPFFVYRPAYFARTGVVYRGAPRPPAFSRPAYTAVARPTVFSGSRMAAARGVGRARPSGFGRTSVRVAGGRITGVRAGRTGSFSRAGARSRGGFFRGRGGSWGRSGGSRGGWG